MMGSLSARIILFWINILLVFGWIKSAPAAIPEMPGIIKFEHEGRSYEILKDPGMNLLKVTTNHTPGPVRDELVLKIKGNHLPLRHIHLRLSSTTPESMVYTGILPSGILLQGNLSFAISSKGNR
ncbi:MAG: hypothetical protein KGP28_06135 [Bdellovibrionales bacterium]|nr:hypothetical protein [Bdellovibrionales bacterium]